MTATIVSLSARRAEREGWTNLGSGQIGWKVYDLHNGMAYVALETGRVVHDNVHVSECHMSEDALTALIEKATRVRDEMRRRRTA